MWEFLTQLEENLAEIAEQFGPWTYAIIAVVIMLETAIFISPFLPGDSLLFTSGVLAARGALNPHLLVALLVCATLLGDTINYTVGRLAGAQLIVRRRIRRDHVRRARRFFHRYGVLALAVARFIPVLRMVGPLTAGMSRIHYPRFLLMDLLGVALWVPLWIYGAFWLGQIEFVRENFVLIIIGVTAVVLTVLGARVWWLHHAHRTRTAATRAS